jgi:sugar lactone lactonase YvrE
MTEAIVFDDRVCELGEGPLWHPERQQLFWFDILGKRLLSQAGGEALDWQFDEHVSAAGWVDCDTLLIASETGLFKFNIPSGARTLLHPPEAGNPITRSNDGRATRSAAFGLGQWASRPSPVRILLYTIDRYDAGDERPFGGGAQTEIGCVTYTGDHS